MSSWTASVEMLDYFAAELVDRISNVQNAHLGVHFITYHYIHQTFLVYLYLYMFVQPSVT